MTKLFLVRRYNDFDHIVPIISKCCERRNGPVHVLSLDPHLSFAQDFRAKFLRENFGVEVISIFSVSLVRNLSWMEKLSHPWLVGIDWARRAVAKIKPHRPQFWKVFNESWARQLLTHLKVEVLVVDFQKPGRFRTLQVLTVARQLGIPVVAVPHGITLQKNSLITNRQQKRGKQPSYFLNTRFFDLILSAHQHFADRLVQQGISASSIAVLGSARFCSEWRRALAEIRGGDEERRGVSLPNGPKGALRVLFVDHEDRYRTNRPVIQEDLTKIAELESVELVIAPGGGGAKEITSRMIPRATIASFQDLRDYLDWTDIVMTLASSVILDGLFLGKPLVYPKYFHSNEMLFEDYAFCKTANDFEELQEILKSMVSRSPGVLMDSEELQSVEKFLGFVVYGGSRGRHVLEEYSQEIERISGQFKKMREAFPLPYP